MKVMRQAETKRATHTVEIEVSGPQDQVTALKPDQIAAFLRVVPNMSPPMKGKVQVEAPKGIVIVQVQPEEVSVEEPAAQKPAQAETR